MVIISLLSIMVKNNTNIPIFSILYTLQMLNIPNTETTTTRLSLLCCPQQLYIPPFEAAISGKNNRNEYNTAHYINKNPNREGICIHLTIVLAIPFFLRRFAHPKKIFEQKQL